MSHQDTVEPALLRASSPHVDQVRRGLVGAAGALRQLRHNPSPERARQLANHFHGLQMAALRLASSVEVGEPQKQSPNR